MHQQTVFRTFILHPCLTFDEIGRYDIAAVIDLVLNVTGASKVNMLVFSQGTAGSLVILSTRLEYNDKVNLLLAYAPVANLSHIGYPLRELIPFAGPIFINGAMDFIMYDYGRPKNKERYGQVEPPAYDIDRITAKIALFSSEENTVADPEDVSLLVERLGSNLLFHYVVEPTDFRHLDFCWGYRANDIVHNLMLDTLEKYSGTST
ncbi:gastric triacylglycerol lipase-like [Rhipicephalus microplus]|uniref:gastric triacylglycerol lipase-like n=1 Tax=Rhipicephalus microplus TaxID=6941 RepID=UPI003F6D54AB